MPLPLPPQSLDVVASIRIDYLASGEMSVSGNIGDKKFAVDLLRQALEAVKHQLRPEDNRSVVVPSRDVEIVQHPNYPTKPIGDMR